MNIPFHNTIGLQCDELRSAGEQARNQEAVVLEVFRRQGRPLTPSDVWKRTCEAGLRWPLTSIRRAITGLTNSEKLVKLAQQRVGMYGKPEHHWALSGHQLELLAA